MFEGVTICDIFLPFSRRRRPRLIVDKITENLNASVKKALKVSRNDCRNFALKFKWDDCTNEFLQSQIDANSGALLFS